MTSSARSFRDLVEDAHEGRLKLPAFQRKWRWRSDKVIKLFDSLRQRFPIGALLFLKGENELLAPRKFEGSNEAALDKPADYLVLDGQQRLTAGIHLLYATGSKQYYLKLDRLGDLIRDKGVDLQDRRSVESFVQELDETDGYVIARPRITDPRSLLIKNHLLCTSILSDATELTVAIADYVRVNPSQIDLAHRLITPHFSLARTDTVPVIEIDSATQIESISRIFTTLNTTGQLLTPFELVVSILYPQGIDLSQEISDYRERGGYYPNMDKTGEVLLQTIAMLGNVSPKKSNLPKNINASLYKKHKDQAFDALEALGRFLTQSLGTALDFRDADLVSYDAIYAPMAVGLIEINRLNERGLDRIAAEKKLSRWYVAAALSQRYQEGIHNKQVKDLRDFIEWISDDKKTPAWIMDITIPRLLRNSTSGAIGRLVRSIMNKKGPVDPVSGRVIGFKPGAYPTEKHHVFPIKYLPGLADWNKTDSGDLALNVMLLESETNKRWINNNPADHISEAEKHQGEIPVRESYRLQFIEDTALSVLKRPSKTKKDFEEFLVLREQALQEYISSTYDFPIGGRDLQDDDAEDE